MPRESSIAAAGARLLKRSGAWSINVHGTSTGRAGVPDCVGTYKGRGFAIEYKQPSGRLSRRQRFELDQLEQAGAYTCVATCVADVQNLLARIDVDVDATNADLALLHSL